MRSREEEEKDRGRRALEKGEIKRRMKGRLVEGEKGKGERAENGVREMRRRWDEENQIRRQLEEGKRKQKQGEKGRGR
jgi:hypothetical protein